MGATKVSRTAIFTPPSKPNIEGIAKLIKDGSAKRILCMTGAGISTSAGIPDFRSPDTGLYANLQQYKLPYPEAIFQLDFFHENPEPFFTLARHLFPGNYKPTLTHVFFRLLEEKQLLLRVFTQNIDTLERAAGLSDERIIEAHGSFASSRCTKCRTTISNEEMRDRIMQGQVVRCSNDKCKKRTGGKGGLVKPDIVFFGEGLPERFFGSLGDFKQADLLIVLGTSLQVQPFASLIDKVSNDCPRLLINLEAVGEMADLSGDGDGFMSRFNTGGFDFSGMSRGGKQNSRDVLYEGKCDEGVRQLVRACGWEEELLELQRKVYHEWESKYEPGQESLENGSKSLRETTVTKSAQTHADLPEAKRKVTDLASDLASQMDKLKVDEAKPTDSTSSKILSEPKI